MATFFWDGPKIERVKLAIKEMREPEDFVSPQVMYLNCFEMTKKGKISLTAYPEEAILFASDNLTDTSGSENGFFAFRRLCQSWCDTQGVKPKFKWMFELFEALCLDKDSRNVIERRAKVPAVSEFGGIKHSELGNNPRAVYVKVFEAEEAVDKAVYTILAHLVCLYKYSTDQSLLKVTGFINERNQIHLAESMKCPPLRPDHKAFIENHPMYKEAVAHFGHEPEWRKHVIFGQYLIALGSIRCNFKHCQNGTLGLPLNNVEEYDLAHKARRTG